jgi:hypothetical protein
MNINLSISATPSVELRYGVGWNWADFLGSGGVYARSSTYPLSTSCVPDLHDEAGWRALFAILDDLRPGFIRFGLPPDPHVGAVPGTIVTDTVHLTRLERLNEWAVRNGCTIMLDTFFIPARYEFPVPPGLSDGKNFVNMAAADNDAYASEFLVPLLRHVFVERDLRAVRLFNPVNEPLIYGVYQTPDNQPDAFLHYVDMYRALDAALRRANLRERIQLVGIDGVEAALFCLEKLDAMGASLDPYVDTYSIHYYFELFDWMTPPARPFPWKHLRDGVDLDSARLARLCKERGKELFMAEAGTFAFGMGHDGDPAGPTRHDAALLAAETVLRAWNAGIAGGAFWSLFNSNDADGWWATVQIREGRAVPATHPYHTYRLLSRHARPGSVVHPLVFEEAGPVRHVHGSWLIGPDGKPVVILINDHLTETHRVELALPAGCEVAAWSWLSKDAVRISEQPCTLADDGSGRLVAELAPMSLNAWTPEVRLTPLKGT